MIRSSSGANCSIRFAPSAMAFLQLQSVRRHGWTGKGWSSTPALATLAIRFQEGPSNADTQLRCRDPRRWQCRDGCDRGDARGEAHGRDDRGGSARWHLPQPRLHAEKSAGRSGTRARRDRARQGAPHPRRQAEPRLGGADRSRTGDDIGHPGLGWRADEQARRRGNPRPWPLRRPNAVAVGGETLKAKHILIATGSMPRRLPLPGAGLMITTDDVLSERVAEAAR